MNSEQLFDFYKKMKRISLVEDAIAERYNASVRKMHTPIHLCNGQEAVAVGVCSNLRREEFIFSNHRSHGHYLAKGGDLKAMIAELYSKQTGCCHGKGGSMHLMDLKAGVSLSSSIVAGNVPIATGFALANKLKGKKDVTCVFFGDGSSEEGGVYESVCFAQLRNVPILYVCENNKYAINTPLSEREPYSSVSHKFQNILRCEVVNGNDVEEVYRVAKDSIEWMKDNKKPVFVECMTYRLRDHSNTGDGTNDRFRTIGELVAWKKRDPIMLTEQKLIKEDSCYKEQIVDYIKSVEKEIEEAFLFAENSEFPEVSSLYDNVY